MKFALIFTCFIAISLPGSGQSAGANDFLIPVVVKNPAGNPSDGAAPPQFVLEAPKNFTAPRVEPADAFMLPGNAVKPVFVVFDVLGTDAPVQGTMHDPIFKLLRKAAQRDEPLSIVVNSVDGLHPIHDLGTQSAVLLAALDALEPKNSSASSTASSTPQVEAAKQRLLSLRKLREGATAIRSAYLQMKSLRNIANLLSEAKGRKAVLWVTDFFPLAVINSELKFSGMPYRSFALDLPTEYERAMRALNHARVSVYTVKVTGAFGLQPGWEREDEIGLEQLAENTGGLNFPTGSNLDDVVTKIRQDTDPYYLLALEAAPQAKPRQEWKKLKISPSAPGVKLRYPQGFHTLP